MPRRRRHRPLLIAVLVLLVAAPASAQQRWRLQEELRIGSLDGPDALGRVSGITTGPAGERVYVTQAREPSIRVSTPARGRRSARSAGVAPGRASSKGSAR